MGGKTLQHRARDLDLRASPRTGALSLPSCGILYVAFGYEYLLMAIHSAISAKRTNPQLGLAIVANSKLAGIEEIAELFCSAQEIDLGQRDNRLVKTNAFGYSPFSRTLLLDCDTEIMGDLSPMFRCLDRYDLITKLEPLPRKPKKRAHEVAPGLALELFPTWNTGALFFRGGDEVRTFFADWRRNFMEMGGTKDQPAFARTVYEHPETRLLSTNYMWNALPTDLLLFSRKMRFETRIWHYLWPYDSKKIARSLWELHGRIGTKFVDRNPEFAADVHEVGRRARVAQAWYRPLVDRLLGKRFKKKLPTVG
jgi:hypothetical protein